MGEQTDQIEQHIRQQRSELGQNIGELQQKVKNTVDWRAQFEHRPVTMIGLALGGGFLLSALLGSKSRPRNYNRTSDEGRSSVEPHKYSVANDAGANGSSNETSQSLRDVKTALIGVAATRFGDVIESFLPGFNDEYNRVRGYR